MKGILNTDPTKRFTIQNIRSHPWYNINEAKERNGILIGVNPIPVS
jgi:5'-AMP-activated protein kinase catalytic alpha subunit